MSKYNIVLRLDSEYTNLGDKAIDLFAIEFFSKIGYLTIIAPDYGNFKKYIYPKLKGKLEEVIVIPDVIDICRPKRFKRKLLRKLEVLLNIISFLSISILPLSILTRLKNPKANLVASIRKADVLVFSGGGYLNENWWRSTLIPLLMLSIIAKLHRIKVILGPSSIGPIITRKFKATLKLLFKIINLIYVREPVSLAIAKDLYVDQAKIRLAKDWGYLNLFKFIINNNYNLRPSERIIAVHIRPWKEELEKEYYEAVWNKIADLKPDFIQIITMDLQEESHIRRFLEFIRNKGFRLII
ncbi:MAG: polysaccharide pyruvyl transferase family protein [Sulfolobales archaeon]